PTEWNAMNAAPERAKSHLESFLPNMLGLPFSGWGMIASQLSAWQRCKTMVFRKKRNSMLVLAVAPLQEHFFQA
ncbi:MAG: hypothetical protein ACI87E_004051, partial [Mariniblastus sp.]